MPGRRRSVEAALRVLAAHRVVARDREGSWDAPDGGDAVYRVTAKGRRLVAVLSDLDVWAAMYDKYPPRDR